MEKLTGSKLRKKYIKTVYCHPAYLTHIQSSSCESQAWITKWNQDCQEKYKQPHIYSWYHSSSLKWRGTKEILIKVKEKSEKTGLKLSIQKTTIMVSSPITSWQIDGETVKTVTDFLFLGSKITVDGDCSHEIKRHLLLRRKAVTNLDSILKKQRHYFVEKGPSSQN